MASCFINKGFYNSSSFLNMAVKIRAMAKIISINDAKVLPEEANSNKMAEEYQK